MTEKVYKKALKEVYVILNASSYDITNKLSNHFKNYLFDKMDDSYNYQIEIGKPLLQQKMMPETKKILTKIYNLYLST